MVNAINSGGGASLAPLAGPKSDGARTGAPPKFSDEIATLINGELGASAAGETARGLIQGIGSSAHAIANADPRNLQKLFDA